MDNEEEEYIEEETRNADGTTLRVMKTRSGVVVVEYLLNKEGREEERRSFDSSGNVIGRAVYELDGERKPLKTTSYDAKGNLVFIKERGKAPIFYGEYQAGAPAFMRADNHGKAP